MALALLRSLLGQAVKYIFTGSFICSYIGQSLLVRQCHHHTTHSFTVHTQNIRWVTLRHTCAIHNHVFCSKDDIDSNCYLVSPWFDTGWFFCLFFSSNSRFWHAVLFAQVYFDSNKINNKKNFFRLFPSGFLFCAPPLHLLHFYHLTVC